MRQVNDDVAVVPLGLASEIEIPSIPGCARQVCFGEGPGAELSWSAGELWWDEQALLTGRGDPPARQAQRGERDGRRGRVSGARG